MFTKNLKSLWLIALVIGSLGLAGCSHGDNADADKSNSAAKESPSKDSSPASGMSTPQRPHLGDGK